MLAEFMMDFVLGVISSAGYFGIFLLMIAESTFMPVPSELVLPFAGYLISSGKFGFFALIIVSLLGSILGSLISYYLGKTFGRKAIIRFGRYFFLNEHDLEIAHKWFGKHGEKTIFFCRFIPAVRHVISIPAGIAEMNLKKFLLYTSLGALGWNTILVFSGIFLRQNWTEILKYSEAIDAFVIAAAVFLVAFFFYSHIRNSRNKAKE